MKNISIISTPAAAFMESAERTHSTRGALAALSLTMLLPSLGTSIANVALPTLAQAFDASFQAVQWIVIAYLLATTSLIVSVGKLGDLFGRRRLLMMGIGVFTAASALCGSATTLGMLIATRALQGLGAAILVAQSMALVSETVPKAKTGSAMGLLGTMSAIGTALGPSLGGVLIAALDWRAIFLINLPLGAAALLLAARYLPADRMKQRAELGRLDVTGTLLLAITLGVYALAMTLGRGQFGSLNVALLLASAVGVSLFIVAEKRVAFPLVRLPIIRDASLREALGMNLLVSTVMMATLVVGPFYLSRALGIDATRIGIIMSIGPLVAALTGVPAGRLVDRHGSRRMSFLGLSGLSAGCSLLAVLPTTIGIPGYLTPIAIMTASYALFQAANNTAVMMNVDPEVRGVLSGLLNLSRNLGLITGAAGLGAVFAFSSGTSDLRLALPEAVASGMRLTFAVAASVTVLAIAIAAAVCRSRPASQ